MEVTAGCSRNTSVGPRATRTALLVLNLACVFSQGLMIDPKPLVARDSAADIVRNFTFCLGTGERLVFTDPYGSDAPLKKLGDLSWFINDGAQPVAEWQHKWGMTIQDPDKYKQYGLIGLEIKNPSMEDAGVYLAYAHWIELGDQHNQSRSRVEMIWPPAFASEKLELTTEVEGDNVTLTCGEVTSFGDTPVTLELKTSEGVVLNSSDTLGILTVTLPKNHDTSDYVCEIDYSNSTAAVCKEGVTNHEIPDPINYTEYLLSALTFIVVGIGATGVIVWKQAPTPETELNKDYVRMSRGQSMGRKSTGRKSTGRKSTARTSTVPKPTNAEDGITPPQLQEETSIPAPVEASDQIPAKVELTT